MYNRSIFTPLNLLILFFFLAIFMPQVLFFFFQVSLFIIMIPVVLFLCVALYGMYKWRQVKLAVQRQQQAQSRTSSSREESYHARYRRTQESRQTSRQSKKGTTIDCEEYHVVKDK